MKNILSKRLIRIVCCLVCGQSLLSAYALGSDYSFKSLTVTGGLSNNSVKAIYQDTLGFVWLGTKNGLNRFDGYECKAWFNHKEEFVGQSNDVVNITPDASGHMWIGTFNGVMLFNPYTGTYKDLSASYQGELPRGVVINIWIENEARIWVATKFGLYLLHEGKSVCVESLRGKYINAMAFVGGNSLLLDIVRQGLVEFDTKTHALLPVAEREERPVLSRIIRDSRDRIWCAADLDHLYLYDRSSHRLLRTDTHFVGGGFKQAQIHDLLEYDVSTLLLATDNGLYALDIGDSASLRPLAGRFPFELTRVNRQMSLYKDRQGSLWVGTFNEGAILYNSDHANFRSYRLTSAETQTRVPLRVVGRLVEYKKQVWVGCNTGLFVIDLPTGNWQRIDLEAQIEGLDANSEIYYIYPLSPNQILLYLLNHGTFLLNLDSLKVSRYDLGMPGVSQIRAIAKDVDKRLWIAQDELSVYDVAEKRSSIDFSTNYDGATRFMYTQDILPYGDAMLVGTRTRGVWCFQRNPKDELNYFKGEPWGDKELENKNVSVLYEDDERNVWVGTYDSGLYLCDQKNRKLVHFSELTGLVNNTICDVIRDKRTGTVWVATLMGISRITKDREVLNYTSRNGFPIHELSGHSFLETSNGTLFVGGKGGVAELLLENLYKSSAEPLHVRITRVETLNPATSDTHLVFDSSGSFGQLELNYGNSSVQIRFSAMDYLYPEGVKYAYRLAGLEKEWNYVNRNEAIYTNLPPGVYTFQIKACGSDGVWGDGVTDMSLIVHPPLWLTVWAKIGYALCLLAFIYFVLRYYYRRKTDKYRLKIEEMEKENMERDYKMKLELFTNFSHELRTPLSLIKGPSEDLLHDAELPRKFIYPVSQICKNANRLLLLVNQLMDFRKLEQGAMHLNLTNVNMAMFMTERIDSFTELLRKRDLSIRYTNDYYGTDWWIDADLMEKVIFNLLSNAIKHSRDGSVIKVVSAVKGDKLLLSVQDFGEGIAPENLNKIFDPFFQVTQGSKSNLFGSGIGLNLAKYVVGLHHGRIWAESTQGEGTVFFIELSLGKEQYVDDPVGYADESVAGKRSVVEKESLKPIAEPLPAKEELPGQEDAEEETVVLLAEDDEDLRKYLVTRLSGLYRVMEAADGKEGLELALDRLPDIIISDVMMPNMNGLEFCEEVKRNPKTAHIPFVMLTAKVMEEHIQEGYSVLADDYVLKPFSTAVLQAKVRSLIRNRMQLRRLFGEKMAAVEVTVPEIAATDPFMEKLIELVTSRASDSELQVSDLYEEMGYGRVQFFRKIKAVSGISPNKLIVDIRMKMAADLLRDNRYTISEVAYQTGFSDPSYFSRVFKSVFQITPKEFQKNQEKE